MKPDISWEHHRVSKHKPARGFSTWLEFLMASELLMRAVYPQRQEAQATTLVMGVAQAIIIILSC